MTNAIAEQDDRMGGSGTSAEREQVDGSKRRHEIHPDLTASRAVDSCGGTFSPEDVASRFAAGYEAALDAAAKAVAKPDALMAELVEALRYIAENDFAYLKAPTPGAKGYPGHFGHVARTALAKAKG